MTLAQEEQSRRSVPLAAPLAIIATLFIFVSATDLYLTTLSDIAEEFGSSTMMVKLTITVNLVAYAAFTLFQGPLADRYGRRRILTAGLVLFAGSSLVCCLSTSLSWLLAGRFGQGIAASAATVLTGLMLRELFDDTGAKRWLSVMAVALAAGPALAPLIGAVVAEFVGWRGNFALLCMLGCLMFILVMQSVPETGRINRDALLPSAVFAKYSDVVKNSAFLRYQLANALSAAGIFAFITGAPFLVMGTFGQSALAYGLMHAGMVVLYAVAATVNGALANRVRPERLLGIGIAGCVMGVMMAMWGVAHTVPLVVVVTLGVAIYSFSIGLVFANSWYLLLNVVEDEQRAAASAVSAFSQWGLSALASLSVALLPTGSAFHLAAAVSLCVVAKAALFLYLRPRTRTVHAR